MPRTVEHLVAIHDLAVERRKAGLPIWQHRVNVAHIWNSDLPLIPDKRDLIVKTLRASSWLKGCDEFDEPAEIVAELAEVADADEFNQVWDALYDAADWDRTWIAIH